MALKIFVLDKKHERPDEQKLIDLGRDIDRMLQDGYHIAGMSNTLIILHRPDKVRMPAIDNRILDYEDGTLGTLGTLGTVREIP